ncbi:hypothetical protein AB0H83_50420 [Dactylosporangium sp. NPDC050688]|uniref:hypothetical protein n=1 Tax=Dactylosporangium sp. NPDC050688 TaxID=3157217 RepID=UPI0033EA5DC9
MGLNMIVGVLADDDGNYAEMVRKDFAAIRELLMREGAGTWNEPTAITTSEFEMSGYSGLHMVRRLAVHLAVDGRLPEPLAEGHKATDDTLLRQVYAVLPSESPGPFDHLVHHSDCEGYYVPAEFERVIVDEKVRGGYLGSSVRLLAETRRIAQAIGLPEDLDPDQRADGVSGRPS